MEVTILDVGLSVRHGLRKNSDLDITSGRVALHLALLPGFPGKCIAM